MKSFKEIIKNKDLLNTINQLKFETPTEIQEKTIPLILEKKDVIGESATGSGKTLAFGCGIIENTESGKGLQSLILTPTRELAEQVKESINQITRDKKLTVTSVYGGVSINHQISKLKKVEIVVATPGRLLDHLQRKTINLSRKNWKR